MDGGFKTWLREQGLCRNCDEYLSGSCAVEDTIVVALRDCCPVLSFRPDPDAPASKCDWWKPEADWERRMRRLWDGSVEDEASYSHHIHGVGQLKGYRGQL